MKIPQPNGRGLKCPECLQGKLRTESTLGVGPTSRVQRRKCNNCGRIYAVVVVLVEDVTPERLATKLRLGMARFFGLEGSTQIRTRL